MGLRKKKSLVDQAAEIVEGFVDTAVDSYTDTVRPHVEAAYGSARGFVADTAIPALHDAKDKAGPVLSDARDKATPVLADARSKAVAGYADAKEAAAPLLAQGASLAAEKAAVARDVADAKVAQLKGQPAPKKKSKLKRIALIAALGGAAAFVAKKLQGGAKTDNWQSSYTPSPAPSPAPAPASTPLEDTAGSSPDEAVADAVEAARPVTTPDDPAEVVDIEAPEK